MDQLEDHVPEFLGFQGQKRLRVGKCFGQACHSQLTAWHGRPTIKRSATRVLQSLRISPFVTLRGAASHRMAAPNLQCGSIGPAKRRELRRSPAETETGLTGTNRVQHPSITCRSIIKGSSPELERAYEIGERHLMTLIYRTRLNFGHALLPSPQYVCRIPR